MVTRAEQKARTRGALIDSMLRIIGDGANFASISLREVTKSAGLVPGSFYRHFGDMDELGLAVVDELGLDLRRLMRGTLDVDVSVDDLVDDLAYGFETYVHGADHLVDFVNQARTGGSPQVRAAIAHELEFFTTRVAGGLPDLVPGLTAPDRDTVAELLLAVLLESITDLLATPEDDEERLRELRAGLAARLRVVVLGAQELARGGQAVSVSPSTANSRARARPRPAPAKAPRPATRRTKKVAP